LTRLNNKSLNVPVQMLADLDIISVQQQTHLDESRVRRNHSVAELGGIKGETVSTETIFRRNTQNDSHERVGDSAVLAEIANERGWSESELDAEIQARRTVLEYLVDNDIRTYTAVANAIQQFYRKRDELVEMIHDETLTEAALREGQQYDIDTLTPSDLGVSDLVEE
jgi:flagellar protein FlaI